MSNTALRLLDIKDIKVGTRFRKEYTNMESLKQSIKEKGIIQPITVNSNLELVAGGRRYTAVAMLKLDGIIIPIPAIIRTSSEELDMRECELFENVEREDLTWQEEANLTKAIDELQREKYGDDWSGRKTAKLLNKSVGGVSENLKLAKVLEDVPELATVKNKKDVLKFMRQVEEGIVVKEKREDQKDRIEKGNKTQLKIADSNFRIGNCFQGIEDILEQAKDNTTLIDIIEVDPPYAIDLAEIKKKEGITNAELKLYTEISKENYPSFLTRLCKLLYAAGDSDSWCIFWFGPTWFTETKAALLNAGFKVDDIPGIWLKGSEGSEGTGQTNSPSTYLARAYETFFIARKGSPPIRKKGRSNVFSFKPIPSGQKYHPTQRPIELIQEILHTFAYPGCICLVPFLGSGNTLRALYAEDMNGFGFELNKHNKDYFMLKVEED